MQRLSYGQHRRPRMVWGFSLFVILLGVANLLLAVDHVRHAGHYRELGVSYPPVLRASFVLVWGVALLWSGLAYFRRQQGARRWILILLSNYGVFRVLWLIVYAQSDYSRGRITFEAALTAVLLGAAIWITRGRRVPDPGSAGASGVTQDNAQKSGEAIDDQSQA